MGVFDKFLDIMRLNDDDDYEDDDFYDDDDFEEEEEERKPSRRGGLFKKDKDDVADDDDYDLEDERPAGRSANKITPMRHPASPRPRGGANMEVCVVKPSNVEDSREITETLLNGRTVILNLEGLDLEIAQRIIDFTSGATYAISGNLQKISNYIFLVTPTNVDISGDLQDLLGNSMDVPSMTNRY